MPENEAATPCEVAAVIDAYFFFVFFFRFFLLFLFLLPLFVLSDQRRVDGLDTFLTGCTFVGIHPPAEEIDMLRFTQVDGVVQPEGQRVRTVVGCLRVAVLQVVRAESGVIVPLPDIPCEREAEQ